MGKVTAVSEDYFNAYGMLQDISKKDRKIHEMGLAVSGNRKGFFKATYHAADQVKEGSVLTDRAGVYWRIVAVVGERYISDSEVFRVVVVQNVTLEGS